MLLLLLCSHSPNDVPAVPQRNVSIAAERGAVRPSIGRNHFPPCYMYTCSRIIAHALIGPLKAL